MNNTYGERFAKAVSQIDTESADSWPEIRRLLDIAETGEEHAEICRLENEWTGIHGWPPGQDPMRGVEFPFASNH